MNRVDWDIMWMTTAFIFSQRSVDESTKHGCVFIDENNKLISMGYNSYPRDCEDDKLPQTRPEKYKITIHSETNAIINSTSSLEGCIAYITGHPCSNCFSNMLNAGIKKIIYGPVGSNCLDETDIDLIKKMNISKKTGKNKIEIIKFQEIKDIEKFIDETKEYMYEKSKLKNLING